MKILDIITGSHLGSGVMRTKELITSKAVKVNGIVVSDCDKEFQKGEVLHIQVGKRRNAIITVE